MRRMIWVAVVAVLLVCAAVGAQPVFRGQERVPADAVVLFDGKDLSKWTKCGSEAPTEWTLGPGYMEVKPGTGNICTKQKFTDFQLHMEFWLPLMENAKGQARANSGVFLQGRYEIQILDSYGLKSEMGDCGGAYGVAPPMINACRPPQTWQTFDIIFRAPKYDSAGKMTAPARATVLHNSVLIHDNVEWSEASRAAYDQASDAPGPIMLQDHGNLIRFRNVWVRPL